ncbi:Na+/H+ antiporter NhaC family protein [Flavobacterium sp. TSSA_36]|uniref:Na+/H+ antiporter NhaC family protein n=1 Tax=Flavobacterium sp. TSSA_36 TaxID=3447669 RepID=UPI003F2B3573
MKSISTIIGIALLFLASLFFFNNSYALVPAFIVLGTAIITRKALEPLIVGCAVGFGLLAMLGGSKEYFPNGENLIFPLNMFDGMFTSIARDAHDQGLIWVILVCILYGAFVQLLSASGGIKAVASYSEKHVTTKKGSLIMAYFLSFFFFLDDYLSALSVGNTMRPITDKFGVSREKLAMVLSFVCVPFTIIFPISTWTIFYGSQLVNVKGLVGADGEPYGGAIEAFVHTIPYNFSAWISLIIGALVVFQLIPDFKLIKQAENEVVVPEVNLELTKKKNSKPGKLQYFILPLSVLVWCTIFPYPWDKEYWGALDFSAESIFGSIDALRGIATGVVFTYCYFLIFKVIKFNKISKHFVLGLETITFVLTVLGFTYLLKDVQNALGFNEFVATNLQGISWLNGTTLPMIVFGLVAWICWATGSNWGIYAILVPTTALLSQSLGADFWLTQGALASGTVWGASACFFSDNRVLTAQACKVDMMKHGIAQFPYQLIIFAISMILYLLAGLLL